MGTTLINTANFQLLTLQLFALLYTVKINFVELGRRMMPLPLTS